MREALAALAELLASLGIRWALIGGVAANLYRRKTRLTGDVDLLLADAGASVSSLEAALSARGWSVRRATPDGDILRLYHATFGWADLQIAGTDYQHEAIRRSRHVQLSESLQIRALAPDDLIVHKLIAGRFQDLADIEALLEAGVAFDAAYVERWAAIWEVTDLWRRVRDKTSYSP